MALWQWLLQVQRSDLYVRRGTVLVITAGYLAGMEVGRIEAKAENQPKTAE